MGVIRKGSVFPHESRISRGPLGSRAAAILVALLVIGLPSLGAAGGATWPVVPLDARPSGAQSTAEESARSTVAQVAALRLELIEVIGGASRAVVAGDGLVFRAVGTRVEVYDASMPSAIDGGLPPPSLLGTTETLDGTITGLARRGRWLYASYTTRAAEAGSAGGLVILDALDVTAIIEIGRIELNVAARDVTLLGDLALVVGDGAMRTEGRIAPSGTFNVIRVADPAHPDTVSTLPLDFGSAAVTTSEDDASASVAYLLENEVGTDTFSVRAIDIAGDGSPVPGERRSLPGEARDILIAGTKLYVAGGSGGVFQFTPVGATLGIPDSAIDVPGADPCSVALAASADGRFLAVGDECDHGVRTFDILGAPRLTSRGRAELAEPAAALAWSETDVWAGTGVHGGLGVVDASNIVRPERVAEAFGFGAPAQVAINAGWAIGRVPGVGLSAHWSLPSRDEPPAGARAALHKLPAPRIASFDVQNGALFASHASTPGTVTRHTATDLGVGFETPTLTFDLPGPGGRISLDLEVGLVDAEPSGLQRFLTDGPPVVAPMLLDETDPISNFDIDSDRLVAVDVTGQLSVHGPIRDMASAPRRFGSLSLGFGMEAGVGLEASGGHALVHPLPPGSTLDIRSSPLVRIALGSEEPAESARWMLGRAPWSVLSHRDFLLVGDDLAMSALDATVLSETRTLSSLGLPGPGLDIAIEGEPTDALGALVVVAMGDAGVAVLRLISSDDADTPTPTDVSTAAATSIGGTPTPITTPDPLTPTALGPTETVDLSRIHLPLVGNDAFIGAAGRFLPVAEIGMDAGVIAAAGDHVFLSQDRSIVVYDTGVEGAISEVGRGPLLPTMPRDFDLDGDRLCAALGSHGVALFDVSAPELPAQISSFAVPGEALAVECREDRMIVAAGSAGLRIFDVTNPSRARPIAGLPLDGRSRSLEVSGKWAVVGPDSEEPDVERPEVTLVDIADPERPIEVGRADGFMGIVAGTTLITGYERTIKFFDIRDPSLPRLITELGIDVVANPIRAMQRDGGLLYVGTRTGVAVIDIRDPTNPRELNSAELSKGLLPLGLTLTATGDRLYVVHALGHLSSLSPVGVDRTGGLRAEQSMLFAPSTIIGSINDSLLAKGPTMMDGDGDLDDDGVMDAQVHPIVPIKLSIGPGLVHGPPIEAFQGFEEIVDFGGFAIGVRPEPLERTMEIVTFDMARPEFPVALGRVGALAPDWPILFAPDGTAAYATERGPVNAQLTVVVTERSAPPHIAGTACCGSTMGGITAPGLVVADFGTSLDFKRFVIFDVALPYAPRLLRYEQIGERDSATTTFAWTNGSLFVSHANGVLVYDLSRGGVSVPLGRLTGSRWWNTRLHTIAPDILALESGETIRLYDVTRPLAPLPLGELTSGERISPIYGVLEVSVGGGWASVARSDGRRSVSHIYSIEHLIDGVRR